MKLEDFAELADKGGQLERSAASAFEQTRAAVTGGQPPRPPTATVTPPPEGEPPAPSYGFQDPAPPDAPKLEPQNYTPEEAQDQLVRYVAVLRRFAKQMHNVSRFADATADLLQHGTVRAQGHNVSNRRSPRS